MTRKQKYYYNRLIIKNDNAAIDDIASILLNKRSGALDFNILKPVPIFIDSGYDIDPPTRTIVFDKRIPHPIHLKKLKELPNMALSPSQRRHTNVLKLHDPESTIEELINMEISGLGEEFWAEYDGGPYGKWRLHLDYAIQTLLSIIECDYRDWQNAVDDAEHLRWKRANWGTEYNVEVCRVTRVTENSPITARATAKLYELRVDFETTIAPPLKWLDTLVKQVRADSPSTVISLEYFILGDNSAAIISVDNDDNLQTEIYSGDKLKEIINDPFNLRSFINRHL